MGPKRQAYPKLRTDRNMQPAPPSEINKEIERLYRLDYGDVGEFSFRMAGSLVGAGIIWLYTGWMLAWIWVAAYTILQLAFFLFLRSKLKRASRSDVLMAHAFFPLLLVSFIWMPILMITSPDDVLSVSGFYDPVWRHRFCCPGGPKSTWR